MPWGQSLPLSGPQLALLQPEVPALDQCQPKWVLIRIIEVFAKNIDASPQAVNHDELPGKFPSARLSVYLELKLARSKSEIRLIKMPVNLVNKGS